MLNDKIEFYGEMLSMRAIALKIGVSRDTLQKHFDKFQDIYEAEKICRKIIEEKNESLIEYNGELLAIQTIAKKERIKDAKTLKRCKVNKYEYNGEMLTINAIAQREGIKGDTLKKYYDKYEDIYLAVNECKELRRKLEESKIEYNGERLTITEISRKARSK